MSKNYTAGLVLGLALSALHIKCLFNKIIFKQYIVNDVEIHKRSIKSREKKRSQWTGKVRVRHVAVYYVMMMANGAWAAAELIHGMRG